VVVQRAVHRVVDEVFLRQDLRAALVEVDPPPAVHTRGDVVHPVEPNDGARLRADDAETVDLLLHAGANPKAGNRYGITPLSEACLNGSAAVIEMLLKAGADPNAPHTEGETPLMTAARTGNPDAVKVLLDHGAQVNPAEAWRGQTALMWAAAENHPQVVKLLIASGANLDARSANFDYSSMKAKAGSVAMNWPRGGFSALLFAAREGAMESVRLLLDAGADINLADPDGTTPLLISIINYHFDIAGLLLDRGAIFNYGDIRGRTPLYAAVDQLCPCALTSAFTKKRSKRPKRAARPR